MRILLPPPSPSSPLAIVSFFLSKSETMMTDEENVFPINLFIFFFLFLVLTYRYIMGVNTLELEWSWRIWRRDVKNNSFSLSPEQTTVCCVLFYSLALTWQTSQKQPEAHFVRIEGRKKTCFGYLTRTQFDILPFSQLLH